jgi:pimeloyl-ACP methyl ester carboxylesterase
MNLLLVRGLVRSQRSWGDYPERLRQQAPQLKLHFLDLPGVGTENGRECPTSIAAIRIDLAKRFHEKIARGEFPKGPWSLVAISMGGMLALDWVDAEPGLFEKVVVINSSSSDLSSPFERFQVKILPRMLHAFLVNRPEVSESLILDITSNRYSKEDPKMQKLLEDRVQSMKDQPVSRLTFFRQITSASRYRLPPRPPKPKTLIVSAAKDRLVSPKCSERLAEKLHAPHSIHPWAGHDLPVDDPEWLARETKEWMESFR